MGNKMKTTKMSIVVFGSAAVGKTALIHRYVTGKFIDRYDPTLDEALVHNPIVDNVICHLSIQDTCGTDQFETVREMYVTQSDGALIVFSAGQPTTFKDVQTYYEVIKRFKAEKARVVVLVMNKIDLEVVVDEKEVESYAQSINAKFVKASAKDNTNVTESFEQCIRGVLERKPPKNSSNGFCGIL
ncbi:hypothetical protein EIN_047340 [Entamoeba invadens IP1]|uniref:Uncharacterized protein n=1 Tax=Entamoeba invadens IP1 TaxID=370355 RepID=A0A0A1UDM5_ENTIV|nr:hypothetical protein EIN_047340 [Entamoeba invadens IP1]ELP94441.1 hypothetical protein EIN_047340 [Entamoeba invadens IP1]|eukprot:XP_004261212.1 hypothetical protein EIN_047340 [Entamoeba invadens IP1]